MNSSQLPSAPVIQNLPVSTNYTNEPMPGSQQATSTRVSAGQVKLIEELDKISDDLKEAQKRHAHINTSQTISWIYRAHKALEQDKPNYTQAQYCTLQARCALVYADKCIQDWFSSRVTALVLIVGYISTLFGLFFYIESGQIGVTWQPIENLFKVPPFVVFWGFIGGVAYCMYSVARWSRQHLFDYHYLTWYLAHPFISAVIGSAITLLLRSGIAVITSTNSSTISDPLLALSSFIAGFSTQSIWKLIDRSTRYIFGDATSTEEFDEEPLRELERSIKS